MQPKGLLALALAKQGFRVFPLPVDDPKVPTMELKKPRLSGDWKAAATSDEAQIAQWWSSSNYNIAIATLPDSAFVVLDYDTKEGQDGAKGLALHDMIYDLPESMRVRTASGGIHVYLRTPVGTSIPNSASKLYKNVDVRGNAKGGYVVAPGSTFHGTPYEIIAGGPDTLGEIPAALVELATIRGDRKSSTKSTEAIGPVDTDSSMARAIEYLEGAAPEAISGAGGNDATYRVACKTRDCGISQAKCAELMAGYWNDNKANPPWPAEDLERIVSNAYEYAELPIGIDNGATVEFGVVPLDTPKKAGLERVKFDPGADSALTRAGDPLIDEVLDVGRLSVMYGQSGSGKTFNALDLAFHIAAGKPWHGNRKVKQGAVIYVAAEGGAGIFKRTAALRIRHGVKAIPLDVVPCPVDLLRAGKDSDSQQLVALVLEAEKDHAQKCELIVIDTLSRALAGGDENASTDMGVLIKHIDRIRKATGAHVMIIHHSGKDQARGARGWSGIRAAVDTEISIHEGRLSFMKQRDIDAADPINFKLESVRIGERADGKEVTSCVVQYMDVADIPAIGKLEKAPLEVLKAMIALAELKIGLARRHDEPRDALCREMLAVELETKDIVAKVGKTKQHVGNRIAELVEAGLSTLGAKCTRGNYRLLLEALSEWNLEAECTPSVLDGQ